MIQKRIAPISMEEEERRKCIGMFDPKMKQSKEEKSGNPSESITLKNFIEVRCVCVCLLCVVCVVCCVCCVCFVHVIHFVITG